MLIRGVGPPERSRAPREPAPLREVSAGSPDAREGRPGGRPSHRELGSYLPDPEPCSLNTYSPPFRSEP